MNESCDEPRTPKGLPCAPLWQRSKGADTRILVWLSGLVYFCSNPVYLVNIWPPKSMPRKKMATPDHFGHLHLLSNFLTFDFSKKKKKKKEVLIRDKKKAPPEKEVWGGGLFCLILACFEVSYK